MKKPMTDKKKIKVLLRALHFYADPDSYFAIGILPDRPCGDFADDFETTYDNLGEKVWRPGKLARETIRKVYYSGGTEG